MKIARTLSLGLLCVAFAGCSAPSKEPDARTYYWMRTDGSARYMGTLTDDEVAAIRANLGKTEFPAPDGTIEKMLPSTLKPYPREFVDGKSFLGGAPALGSFEPIGGNVMDYWLNQRTVLRVGTVYYYDGQDHFSREEWFELMTPDEAYQFDERGPAGPNGKTDSGRT